ncbi:hypothetical protein [Streptomyces sp. NBC_01373]|uniref:hypothetical protein n=1 Tax=Streptomyces sp. NBC_01373 TaxID=2903843 RepID=UPI002250586C|nr:hypothetical protein [Streptomyces sp. NBC_01373]MCX4704378.1 hypothetical protein [Streptomyces sp. NBC_01373]MCX4707118.1 hypothetical protein [Streptomyces sp. NBC_01373]
MSGDEEGAVRPAGSPDPDYFICEKCPHCNAYERRTTLDWHIATDHADLPSCTASIVDDTANETIHCAFRVGHRDEHGDLHAGPLEKCGRLRWADWAHGATPHQSEGGEQAAQEESRPPEADQLRADNESLRYQIQRAREALATDEPVSDYDERVRQAEIRAAVAEHEADAYRNQVQALVRELLRMREVPEEDLPRKVSVIIVDEEAP